jgi:hypothetical protein
VDSNSSGQISFGSSKQGGGASGFPVSFFVVADLIDSFVEALQSHVPLSETAQVCRIFHAAYRFAPQGNHQHGGLRVFRLSFPIAEY